MKYFKLFFELYLFSNIHVAIATWALVKLTLLPYGASSDYSALFVFFTTIVSYNFIRLYRFKTENNWFSLWIQKNKTALIIVSVFAAIGSAFTLFFISLKALLVLLPFGFFTIFYSLPFFKKSLRTVPFAKLFLIALSWAGTTVLFPLRNHNIPITTTVLLLFAQRFLFIICITLPFDIRDLDYDAKGLKTIPQILDVKNTKILASLLIILLVSINHYTNQNAIYAIALITFLGIVFSTKKQNKYYAAFWIESIPIIWYFMVLYIN